MFPLSPTNFELQLISRKGRFQEDVEGPGGDKTSGKTKTHKWSFEEVA